MIKITTMNLPVLKILEMLFDLVARSHNWSGKEKTADFL
jgi:hypothetical protein